MFQYAINNFIQF